jgi:hypothetical protein
MNGRLLDGRTTDEGFFLTKFPAFFRAIASVRQRTEDDSQHPRPDPAYKRGMSANQSLHPRLSDLPLWRLLVALDDAERTAGPDSQTVRVLARAVQERLRSIRPPLAIAREARHAD